MKWKTKLKTRDTSWVRAFVWAKTRTEDGYTVIFETVWRKWKVHMDGGKFIYSYRKPFTGEK